MLLDPEYTQDMGPISFASRRNLDLQHWLLSELPRLFHETAQARVGKPIQPHDALAMKHIQTILDEALRQAFTTWEERSKTQLPVESSPELSLGDDLDMSSGSFWSGTPGFGTPDWTSFDHPSPNIPPVPPEFGWDPNANTNPGGYATDTTEAGFPSLMPGYNFSNFQYDHVWES